MSKPWGAIDIAHIYLSGITGILVDKAAVQHPLSPIVKAQRLPTT
ncbi:MULTISPECIES: hypothetical protein [Kosakonia]|nr:MULTISPECIES: hypothetical protein [Kosakonia]